MAQPDGGRFKADVDRLMGEGLRSFREGRTAEAAHAFRQAAEANPGNEFAWIWVAQTATSADEQRHALERALVANPDSKYASDALRRLNLSIGAQQTAEMPAIQPAPVAEPLPINPLVGSAENVSDAPVGGRVSFPVEPAPPPPPDLRNAPPPQIDDLRSTLVGTPQTAPRTQKNARRAETRPAPPPRNQRNVRRAAPPKPMRRSRTNWFVLLLLGILLALIVVIVFFLANFLINGSNPLVAVSESTATAAAPTAAPSATVAPTQAATATVIVAPALPTTTPAPPTATAIPATATAAPPTGTIAPVAAANTAAADAASRSSQIDLLYTAAQTLTAQGKDADAAAQLEQAAALDRNNATVQYQLGLAYLRLARATPPGTATITSTATSGTTTSAITGTTTSSSTAAPVTTADALDKAVAALQRVTVLLPNWPGGYLQLAQALTLKGNLTDAIIALRNSLDLDASGTDRWLLLADLYERNNQPNEAIYARSRAGITTVTATTPQPTR